MNKAFNNEFFNCVDLKLIEQASELMEKEVIEFEKGILLIRVEEVWRRHQIYGTVVSIKDISDFDAANMILWGLENYAISHPK